MFNLYQFCDIFHIILKSLSGSVVFLFYLAEFRLESEKVKHFGMTLLAFCKTWKTSSSFFLFANFSSVVLIVVTQSVSCGTATRHRRVYLRKRKSPSVTIWLRVPDRLEPVVSVNTEEVSARQKVL